MSQSLSRRSFLKRAGSGAVSLAAALLTGVCAAAQEAPLYRGEPALLDGKAAVELLGYAPAPGLNGVLVYLSVENLSSRTLPVGASYLQSRQVRCAGDLYRLGTGVTAACGGVPVRCGSFAAPLYAENAADASAFTLNLAGGCGALVHCFCETPEDWQTLELTCQPDFAAGRAITVVVRRGEDEAVLGPVPSSPAEVGSVVEL
ncbi:MAG: twin-arginine translocation signal domain-containing protein [Faecalibacterium sp.]